MIRLRNHLIGAGTVLRIAPSQSCTSLLKVKRPAWGRLAAAIMHDWHTVGGDLARTVDAFETPTIEIGSAENTKRLRVES